MKKYDALRWPPVPEYDGAKVKALRSKLQLSQAVLTAVLNTSV
jgi:putative transcriptional regulator